MKKTILAAYYLGIVMLLLFSCAPDAPHSNPLDPYRATNSGSGLQLKGIVQQKTDPFLPLPQAQLSLLPEQHFSLTDEKGEFSFEDLRSGLHTLIISKTNFVPDTHLVNLDTLGSSPLHYFLNGRPQIREIRIYSEFIDQWWPEAVTRIHFELIGADPDGVSDLQSADMALNALGLSEAFSATARPDSFFLQISDQKIAHDTLLQMVGRDMRVRLNDASGGQATAEPLHLIRIMEVSPQAQSPSGLQVTTPSPLLQWESYQVAFAYTYQVSIFFVSAGIPIRIHQVSGISPEILQYQYPDSLPSGTYYWTLGVRDALGNLSRSKEASFLVQ